MSFLERFEKILSRTPAQSGARLWSKSLSTGAVLTGLFFVYLLFSGEGALDFYTFNQALANAGTVLIGYSFLLSGVCYFWDFWDRQIIYRKHMGLTGFWLVVGHAVLTMALPSFSAAGFFSPENIVAFLLALAALGILIMMAAISNRLAATELGPKRWRALLRTGYLAYFFALGHFAIKKYSLWQDWWEAGSAAPPLSLVVAVFVLAVFLMRAALEISLRTRRAG
ncbi:MAG TPA: hypothetical protein ENJ77_01575 [Candidatus Moranbacteria bacterium]|nr:hypothetical protein [Candidatus Moranbacteria bacterium]